MTVTDDIQPQESTPLLGIISVGDSKRELLFRRKSVAKLSIRQVSNVGDDEEDGALVKKGDEVASPVEGLAPLFHGGIQEYDGRAYVPYREATLLKSTPAFAPYRRKARHRSYYLWWTNVSSCISYVHILCLYLSAYLIVLIMLYSLVYIAIVLGISSLVEKFTSISSFSRIVCLFLRSIGSTQHTNAFPIQA